MCKTIVGFLVLSLLVCIARGPREKGWIGWSGGWSIKRDDLPREKATMPTERIMEEAAATEETGDQKGPVVQESQACSTTTDYNT